MARRRAFTKRQSRVMVTASRNVADRYNLTRKGQRRFLSSMKKAYRRTGYGTRARQYTRTATGATRWAAGKREARGARRVLRRAARRR
jgi:hypothetical protein